MNEKSHGNHVSDSVTVAIVGIAIFAYQALTLGLAMAPTTKIKAVAPIPHSLMALIEFQALKHMGREPSSDTSRFARLPRDFSRSIRRSSLCWTRESRNRISPRWAVLLIAQYVGGASPLENRDQNRNDQNRDNQDRDNQDRDNEGRDTQSCQRLFIVYYRSHDDRRWMYVSKHCNRRAAQRAANRLERRGYRIQIL